MTDRPTRPRLAPLPVTEMDADAREALSGFMGGAGKAFLSGEPDAPRMPNVLATLLHHPRLVGPWLDYNDVLLRTPSLEPRHRELLILRVAWRCRSNYEWLQHVLLGKQTGIRDDELRAITEGKRADSFTPLECDLLTAADQLLDDQCVEDATWARLTATLDRRQMVELVFTVGTYTCLAMAFNSFGLQLDPGLDPAAAPAMPAPVPAE